MNKKNILCFGDSNTWGFVPGVFDPETLYMERYPKEKRWPGVMEKILGNNYHIIEEGLNGRTTNIEYPDLEGKSGVYYIIPCLYSHAPLDLVIIQLGINDLKIIFNRTIHQITDGISEIIDKIQSTLYGLGMQSAPDILLVSPPPLVHEKYLDSDNKYIFEGGMKKSLEFDIYYSAVAKKSGCHYIDLSKQVKYSKIDGLHLDEFGHKIVGEILANKIMDIFKKIDSSKQIVTY